MLPFLKILSDGDVHHVRDVGKLLGQEFKLTEQELSERIPSGKFTILESRVGWARTYLKKAGLIEPVARGQYRITARGTELLKSTPSRIDNALLRQYPEFRDFLKPRTEGQTNEPEVSEQSDKQTPLEVLEG